MIIELLSLGAMVQALRAHIDWKSPFLKGVGHFGPKFQVEGDILCTASEYLTTLLLKVFTQRNFVADFLREKSSIFYTENEKNFAFEAPFLGLGATYAVHLWLIGKLVVDFLLVIIELFPLGASVFSQ